MTSFGENGAVDEVLVRRLVAGAALALLLGGFVLALRLGREESTPAAEPTRPAASGAKPKPKPKAKRKTPLRAVRLTAVGALDPEGDGRERDDLAPLAVDGNPATAWRTERYSSFFKDGVGLVLDAGRSVRIARVVVSTQTPGVTAELRLGARAEGPFRRIAPGRSLAGATTFAVPRRTGRYLVIWITELPDGAAAELAEVRLLVR